MALRLAFTRPDHRMQRKSDGTVVIEGRRFEIPNRYRHLTRLEVRYAGWEVSSGLCTRTLLLNLC
jgi:hypothetical protein